MSTSSASPVAIVIHAGAGGKGVKMAPEKEKEYHKTLTKALRAGHAVLDKKGSALEAVQAAIVVMEDSTLFNAGKGAVFTSAGENELDASIMDGNTLLGGNALGRGGVGQEVAGDLLGDKLVKGHVIIESVNHPVTVSPAIAKLVGLETIAIGVARQIEPLSCPVLPIGR